MRPDGVVVDAPALDQDDRFLERVEDFAVEQLVPEFAVEGLVVSILPGCSRLDVEGLHANTATPRINEPVPAP